MYIYIRSEPQLWTVGHYTPSGKWEPESDHSTRNEAANRVAYLNGDSDAKELHERIAQLEAKIADLKEMLSVSDKAVAETILANQ